MLEAIRTFFRTTMAPPEEETPGTRSLELAACALLLELAHSDEEFTEDERRHVEAAVRRHFGLGAAEADELLRLAEAERRQAVDLWQFTRLVNESYSLGQKTVLAEIMWGLVYSDGELAEREDQLMRKISHLLHVQPGYLAEARKRVREQRGLD